jgi:hypothetical protein
MSKAVKIRFPNESYPFEIYNFDMKDFKLSKKYEDEVFGYWKATYIALDRKDYERLRKQDEGE